MICKNFFDRYNTRSKIGCVTRHNSRAKRWMRCRSRLRHLLRCTLRWVWLLLYKNFTLLCSLRMEAWLRSLENVKLKLTSLSHAIVLKVVNLKQFMFELRCKIEIYFPCFLFWSDYNLLKCDTTLESNWNFLSLMKDRAIFWA